MRLLRSLLARFLPRRSLRADGGFVSHTERRKAVSRHHGAAKNGYM